MQILKEFPIKDLVFKLFAITALFLSFKIFTTSINTKRDISTHKTKSIKNKPTPHNHKKLLVLEKKLKLVEKLDARIEEKDFLLSQVKENDPNFEKKILKINEELKEIEKTATTKKVQNLIDQTLIDELKNKIKSYQQIFRS